MLRLTQLAAALLAALLAMAGVSEAHQQARQALIGGWHGHAALLAALAAVAGVWPSSAQSPDLSRLALVGDYGWHGDDHRGVNEGEVAALVRKWDDEQRLDAVLTLGDNNYMNGTENEMDINVGRHYSYFMYPYRSFTSPALYQGAPDKVNRFFPATGNHDWGDAVPGSLQPYLDFFAGIRDRRGNPQYFYTRRFGPVAVFFLDSDRNQRRLFGTSSSSEQARWLKSQLEDSRAPWKVVICHHPPYSSGGHGSHDWMQWPFFKWGAHLVLSGHEHSYEKLVRPEGRCPSFPFLQQGGR